jgi:hypothetical protein
MAHQDVKPDTPSHTKGTPRGEERAKPAHTRETRMPSDATGIRPMDAGPIDKRMPILPPA